MLIKKENISIEPIFRSFLKNAGAKPYCIVESNKSSSLVIRSTSDFAKMANANCGMWDLKDADVLQEKR